MDGKEEGKINISICVVNTKVLYALYFPIDNSCCSNGHMIEHGWRRCRSNLPFFWSGKNDFLRSMISFSNTYWFHGAYAFIYNSTYSDVMVRHHSYDTWKWWMCKLRIRILLVLCSCLFTRLIILAHQFEYMSCRINFYTSSPRVVASNHLLLHSCNS